MPFAVAIDCQSASPPKLAEAIACSDTPASACASGCVPAPSEALAPTPIPADRFNPPPAPRAPGPISTFPSEIPMFMLARSGTPSVENNSRFSSSESITPEKITVPQANWTLGEDCGVPSELGGPFGRMK